MKYICEKCDKEYTNERYYLLHIDKCNVGDDLKSSKELIEESDSDVSIEIVKPLEATLLNKEEQEWFDRFSIGFRFNGQVRDKDVKFLVDVYKKVIKKEINGCIECSNTLIFLATSIISKLNK